MTMPVPDPRNGLREPLVEPATHAGTDRLLSERDTVMSVADWPLGEPVPQVWIDASAGSAGDMLLGALLDAGASLERVNASVAALGLPEAVEVRTEAVTRAGMRATRAHVEVAETATRRDWAQIRDLLHGSRLGADIRAEALAVFSRLAEAEARVHGIAVTDVHFHEVGALDCLTDIVGVVTAMSEFRPHRIFCSPITVGFGRVDAEHGSLPIPGPAVTELLATRGPDLIVTGGRIEHEACTPTAAALLAHYVDQCGPMPTMTVEATGIGAGTRDTHGQPNVVRVLRGFATEPDSLIAGGIIADQQTARTYPPEVEEQLAAFRATHGALPSTELRVEIACNVDDLDPRVWPYVIERLLHSGADDAWTVPIAMKKSRRAVTLRVLCEQGLVPVISDVIIAETSTIGLRVRPVEKLALDREYFAVEVAGNPVRVKVARHRGSVVNVSAEYEDAAAAARATGLPLAGILREAVETALKQSGDN
ncbi:MAG: nickel pincer cofactor biosynthesis protein LarC [Candidatus Nanopelagicales bacterium]